MKISERFELEDKVRIYVVDDENAVVLTLKTLIGRVFPKAELIVHNEGAAAWSALNSEASSCIIVSDINMPGLNGLQLLKKIRLHDTLKDAYVLMITANLDPETNLKTLQQGADDFLPKPISVDTFIAKMRTAMRHIEFQKKAAKQKQEMDGLKDELNKNVDAMYSFIENFQNVRMAEITKSIERITEAAAFIARYMADTEEEIWNIKRAAKICYCGKLFLKENLIFNPVMIKGIVYSEIMHEVPKFANKMVSKIPGQEKIVDILVHIYENFDATGIPDQKKSWEIPLGSRILRVAMDYEELLKKNAENEAKTMEILYLESKRLYDNRVVAYYDQFLGSREVSRELGKKGRESAYKINELEEGMILARNVMTESGLNLMASGITLSEEKIDKIRLINKSDAVIGKIYVRNK